VQFVRYFYFTIYLKNAIILTIKVASFIKFYMQKVDKNALGLVVGGFMAVFHLGWIILVGLGWAKPLMDLAFKLHRISLDYSISSLTLLSAIGLLVFTFVAGYVFGWVFAAIWNKFGK